MHANIFSYIRGLNFSLNLHLHPCFICASSEGSGHICTDLSKPSLFVTAISTYILCTGSNKHAEEIWELYFIFQPKVRSAVISKVCNKLPETYKAIVSINVML